MAMSDPPFTAVQIYLRKRRWGLRAIVAALLLIAIVGLATLVLGTALAWRYTRHTVPEFTDDVQHFEHGSIGAEDASGLPYKIWKTLPEVYPERFGHRRDYRAFGFLYETDAKGHQADLPIGIARSRVNGVDMVWFNCATCHTGSWRDRAEGSVHVVPGMPSNNLDLYGLIRMLLDAGADEKMSPDKLLPAIEKTNGRFGPIDKLMWRYVVIPRVREGLVMRRSRLGPLLETQPEWGPGRVDTFNPYKMIQFGIAASTLSPQERIGTADFPAVFNQAQREGMNLHWDGNNNSLAERNLSAALGAGVTPDTVNHGSIERVAAWLKRLPAPASPNHPDPGAVSRGGALFQTHCAVCHGWNDPGHGYVFKGDKLGKVEPIATLQTDPARLDSYTQAFRDLQVGKLFYGTPYRFSHFRKTDGYANLPLDGLWLRGPYLHNGSVPTLAALLMPPARRPAAFVRGLEVIDRANGGFVSPPCTPGQRPAKGICFDTRLPGNGAGGHVYGTQLPEAQRRDLLAYLLTF